MRSAAPPSDSAELERALTRSLTRRFRGAPVDAMMRWHFGLDEPEAQRGKRLRMRLTLAAAAEEGATAETALDAACAVELVHNYSLVHDDIEDGDRLRHGRPTVWARFGVADGINTGDAICAIAYLALLDPTIATPPERTVAMTRILHEATVAMVDGQSRDIAFETAARVEMDDYLAMIRGKTAALFGAACALGALAAGSAPARAQAYAELGEAYGAAFQIEDDLLGTWGDSATTGKPAGADLARRKWTFPVVWALAHGAGSLRDRVAAVYAAGEPLEPALVTEVAGALDALGARSAAAAAVEAELRRAEALAGAAGIDAGRRVRELFFAATRRVA